MGDIVMTIGEVDYQVGANDSVKRSQDSFDKLADLTERNTVAAFLEAMRASDGFVPVETVAAYLLAVEAAHEKEVNRLKKEIELLSGDLDPSMVNQPGLVDEKPDTLFNV